MCSIKTIDKTDIVTAARSWIDTPYHHQGRLKKTRANDGGVDCIGLIIGVAKELAIMSKIGLGLLCEFDEADYSKYSDLNCSRLVGFLSKHLHLVYSADDDSANITVTDSMNGDSTTSNTKSHI